MPSKESADWTTNPEDLTHLLEILHDKEGRIGDGGNFDKSVMNETAVEMATKWPPKKGGPQTAKACTTKWKAALGCNMAKVLPPGRSGRVAVPESTVPGPGRCDDCDITTQAAYLPLAQRFPRPSPHLVPDLVQPYPRRLHMGGSRRGGDGGLFCVKDSLSTEQFTTFSAEQAVKKAARD
ncbi:hypothetical protein DFH07DRAFT_772662 [Mycena maculata]|uniref:Myb/SANT-like domain-containing protein n=1 Tax=Mycena maculata TaxID=230809 RepID=A0AAD7J6I1_9AGAR|nr:hypothetical protein DFH07DRAFT_772662 [Mycena maculata]